MRPAHRLLSPAAGLTALALVTLAGRAAEADPQIYQLDPEHTSIAFMVEHIGYEKLIGLFLKVEGAFTYDHEAQELKDLSVTIPAESVFTNNEARDTHIRSQDFLNAAPYPDITFVMYEAEATGPDSGTVTGDLTIGGSTQPVTLAVTLNKIGDYPFPIGGKINNVIGYSARAEIRRSDFGITYALADGLVGDTVEILSEGEAIRQ